MFKRALLICLAGWLVILVTAAADPDIAKSETEETLPPPSFAPGANVTLALNLKAPSQWHLNYLVPIRVQFDEEYLKEAPFTVKKTVWDFTIESYLPRHTIEIPVYLKLGTDDGTLKVPFKLQCSICEMSGESCTFCMENVSFPVEVLSTAPADSQNQALAEGTADYDYRLSLP
ncbi:hypothetical protein JW859_07670 [bacterium]|nr:hypothetical protein [bacterium]